MKKDTILSVRINRGALEALELAAKKDRCTVASLLDKIIVDYLRKGRVSSPAEARRKETQVSTK